MLDGKRWGKISDREPSLSIQQNVEEPRAHVWIRKKKEGKER